MAPRRSVARTNDLDRAGSAGFLDAITRKQEMSDEERLRFHQKHSAGFMEELDRWMTEQLEEKKVEPNSSLGQAFSYMLKRWDNLTLFLRVPGAPLDNNICERVLKKAILHRKNALFFKTKNGARVADIYMTLIHSAELTPGVNPHRWLDGWFLEIGKMLGTIDGESWPFAHSRWNHLLYVLSLQTYGSPHSR